MESHSSVERLPAWVSDDLVAQTLEVWQPRYGRRLTECDAIEILLSVGHLFDALGDADGEAVSSVSTSL